MNPADIYPVFLFALCIWREARGETANTKQAVAWSVRNRVNRPRWWGHDYVSCILMPFQYSSFNHNDPNAVKFPTPTDPSWQDSMQVALAIYDNPPTLDDNSNGADSYFDKSLDNNPPAWAAVATKTADIGSLHFYRTA
jgi:cell wall hydrolase